MDAGKISVSVLASVPFLIPGRHVHDSSCQCRYCACSAFAWALTCCLHRLSQSILVAFSVMDSLSVVVASVSGFFLSCRLVTLLGLQSNT
jgi:hypothetical protein